MSYPIWDCGIEVDPGDESAVGDDYRLSNPGGDTSFLQYLILKFVKH